MASEGFQDIQVRSVPRQLLKDFDEAIKDEFPSRAEAVRSLMRDYVRRKKPEAS